MNENRSVRYVIPVYNEEEVISSFYNSLIAIRAELWDLGFKQKIVFVNDGSSDETWNIIDRICSKDKNCSAINLSRNFGHQIALLAGLSVPTTSQYVVTIDCDGQDPVEVSIEMLKIMLATKSDVVFARRRMRSDSFFKRITAKYFYKLVYRNEDSNFFQNVADYRLMNSDFLAEFIKYSERNPYLRGIAANMGFRREFVDFDRPERIEGDSKYTIRKMFGLAFDGIFSFTAVPLRFIFFLSIFSISITLLAVIYAVCSYLFTSNVKAGWASIIVFISFFSSIIIFSLGVIGIYLEKIFQESKQRPAFHIQDAINCEFVDSRVNTNNGYTAL